jgi:CspA family cold shock protein
MYSNESEVTSTPEILTGRVKWFNNKTGFGFITITDGSNVGNDIFVHHSAVKVLSEQYKYLVQGEYVEFSVVETTGSAHKFQASEVKGIKGGQLMCETRREFKVQRSSYINDKFDSDNQNRNIGRGPRSFVNTNTNTNNEDRDSNNNWKEVVSKSNTKEKTVKPRNQIEPANSTQDPKKRGRKPKNSNIV